MLSRTQLIGTALVSAVTLAVSACGSDDPVKFDEPTGGTGGVVVPEDFAPAPGGVRRMLAPEYVRSVDLLLGPEAAAAAAPPSDIPQEGFDAIGATKLSVAVEPVEYYERSAEAIADATLTNPSVLGKTAPCVLSGQASDACYTEVATELGRMFYRRTLTTDEINALVDVAKFTEDWFDENKFDEAIKYELMAILQSPQFLYISEIGEMDEESGFRLLTDVELAGRMSFFLLGRTPDAKLLDAAEAGDFSESDTIQTLARDMLKSPVAKDSLDVFYDELFRLRFLATTSKNAEVFPTWSEELSASMREETLLLIEDVIWAKDVDVRSIFNANYTYVNNVLADHYDMTAPTGAGFQKVNWPAGQMRAGYTSQGSFLAHQSGPLRNSPTKRGKFIMQFLLCKTIPPPPPNVVPELPEDSDGLTLQEQLEAHLDDPACSSCHGLTDPVGFAFEHFNGIGEFRTKSENKPIDGYGSVNFLGEWNNAKELGDILATHEDTAPCIINNLVRGKIGHTETKGESTAVDLLNVSFEEEGFSMQSLLVEMTTSPLFRFVGEPR